MSRMMLRKFAISGGHAMGMDKSGTQTIGSSETNQQIINWSVRAGLSDTVITSHQLRPDGAMSITVIGRLTLSANWFSGTPLSVDIMKNSSVLVNGTIAFGNPSVTFSGTSTTVTATDTLWMRYTSPFGGSATINAGSTNTYLYYTVP